MPGNKGSYALYVATARLLLILSLAFAVNCAEEAAPQGIGPTATGIEADAAAVVSDAGTPGTGGAQGTATGAGGAVATGAGGTAGGTGGTGMVMGQGGTGGTAPASSYSYCPQYPNMHRIKPGFLNKDLSWTSRWKDGYACAICTYGPTPSKLVAGCLIKLTPELDGPEPLLCVQDQGECCYKVVAICERDSDCCAPLRCTEGEPGKGKGCR